MSLLQDLDIEQTIIKILPGDRCGTLYVVPFYPNLLTQDFCVKFTILQSIGAMWGGIEASTM